MSGHHRLQMQPLIELQRPVPSQWFEIGRPTVVTIILSPDNSQSLLMILPKAADDHGWIFPQQGINPRETVLEAALRELADELGFRSNVFKLSEAKLLLPEPTRNLDRKGNVKLLIPVLLQQREWKKPRLPKPGKKYAGENRGWFWCRGPNCLWEHIPGCSESKRAFMVTCLRHLVEGKLLRGQRWQEERIAPVMSFA